MNDCPKITLLVVGAVLEENGRLFIARRRESDAHGGLWEFPGGKVESGETPQEALVRECREELNIEVEVGPLFDVVFSRDPEQNILLLFYLARMRQGQPEARGCAEFAWVCREELDPEAFLPADRPVLEQLQRTRSPLWR